MLLTKNLPRDKPPARSTATNESRVCYIHPHVFPDRDPAKGRFLRAKDAIPQGTVLFVDTAYAIVPTVSPDGQYSSICSNLACSRRITQKAATVHCPRGCIVDVAWCNRSCRAADSARHDYECLWLRRNAQTVQRNERHYDFATIWHVVRLLAGWSLETRRQPLKRSSNLPGGFKDNWEAVELCCDYLDSWPKSQLEHWVRLIDTYLAPQSGLPHLPSPEKLLSLICKEETNTFGLYPKVTGLLNTSDTETPRGECYGFGLYPRAAAFNHSCQPNVTHQPDECSRMVYKASRDILKGDEVSITYFDLAAHKDVESRQQTVQDLFRFRCTCDRCLKEEEENNLESMEGLPFCCDF